MSQESEKPRPIVLAEHLTPTEGVNPLQRVRSLQQARKSLRDAMNSLDDAAMRFDEGGERFQYRQTIDVGDRARLIADYIDRSIGEPQQ